MAYLQPQEYVAFGLPADTADAWVAAASAMMDAHCRRTSLLATSYTERFRLGRSQRLQLSYGPVQSVNAVRARYARGREGCGLADIAAVFGLPGEWVSMDAGQLDVDPSSGKVQFVAGLFGLAFTETEITYKAGFATVPDALKVACAQVVRNAQATPGLNVRSARVDTLETQYFSDSLLDEQVRAMLRPFLAERLSR